MDEIDRTQVEEILRLSKDTNRMLHSMRRSAWIGGFLKMIFWVALFIIPLYLYMQYIAPVTASMLEAMQQIQGVSQSAGNQMSGLQDALGKLQELQSQIPNFLER